MVRRKGSAFVFSGCIMRRCWLGGFGLGKSSSKARSSSTFLHRPVLGSRSIGIRCGSRSSIRWIPSSRLRGRRRLSMSGVVCNTRRRDGIVGSWSRIPTTRRTWLRCGTLIDSIIIIAVLFLIRPISSWSDSCFFVRICIRSRTLLRSWYNSIIRFTNLNIPLSFFRTLLYWEAFLEY